MRSLVRVGLPLLLGPAALARGATRAGVDRAHYTKGIAERLRAVARTLERFPHLVGRFTLTTPPAQHGERMRASRSCIAEFNVYRWRGRMRVEAARVQQNERLSDRPSPGLRAIEGGRA